MHAISYYRPRDELPGVRLHVLRSAGPGRGATAAGGMGGASLQVARAAPPFALRLINAVRYQRAGLRATVESIAPDVFHAHFVVEHGFYGSFVGFHPYVVSAWGSDLFLALRTPVGRLIARRALGRADLVTANDAALARRAVALGVAPERVAVVRLGVDPLFLSAGAPSVNLRPSGSEPLTVLSDRALERLYNVDVVIRAFAALRQQLPAARLLVANDGSERSRLEELAQRLGQGDSVRFLGRLDPQSLRRALAEAQVYVSVPSSDSLALSTMEAMAVGAFPVVTDLPSQDGWVVDQVNGLRAPVRSAEALTRALLRALTDADLRRQAVAPNRARVEADGVLEKNMLLMERLYYRLAGRPLAGDAAI